MRNIDKKAVPRVLVACGDTAYGNTLARFLQTNGHVAEACFDAPGILRNITRHTFDVIVLDLDLGDQADLDLVSFARRRHPATQIVLLFDISKIDRALDGIRQGAFFYLPRTCQPSDVALVVDKAVRAQSNQIALNLLSNAIKFTPAGGTVRLGLST